jgi:cytosine/adenosine deaminase-related metal-dependent hydrolase
MAQKGTLAWGLAAVVGLACGDDSATGTGGAGGAPATTTTGASATPQSTSTSGPTTTASTTAMSTSASTTSSSGGGGEGGLGGFGGTGGQGGEGGQGGVGGDGGQGGGGTINVPPDAQLLSLGDPDKILLRGIVVTPDIAFDGEVLVVGGTIACVDIDCSADPDAPNASVVETHGIVMPGMIDTHNHILFGIFDETDWTPMQAYQNHNQWTNEARYDAVVDAKQYLNGESGSPVNVNCEMDKYGELKALVAGTTSVLGAANPANKTCYRTLARTIDQSANGLCGGYPPGSCPDEIQVATLFPPSGADGICTNLNDGSTDAFFVHCGEGTNAAALNELTTLFTTSTTDGCLFHTGTTIIHGTAFGDPEFESMAANGMGLVWSPASNVFLYGGGTDLTQTTNVPLALSKGITVALAPDWSMGGSQNLLDELRFADVVDDTEWGDVLSSAELVGMVTKNAAELLAQEGNLGELTVGAIADITVIGLEGPTPWDAIVAAEPEHVRLVMVGGVVLYGDDQLQPLGPANPGCEALDICGTDKFVCVATTGGTSTNLFGQTLTDITTNLTTELAAYDALDLSPWDFSPIVPLVKCQ